LSLLSPLTLACDALHEDATRAQQSAQAVTPRVEVFVTDWCPYCRQLEDFLRENRVQYVRYNVEQDENAAREHRKLSDGGIPVTRIGTQVVLGFRPKLIAELLWIDPAP